VMDSTATDGLSPRRAALLVVDVQERLLVAMPASAADRMVRNTLVLLEAARRLRMPVVLTEQYPKGLGPTAAALGPALAAIDPELLHRFDKLDFSAAATPQFSELAPKLGRDQWLLVGMETHVCVLQTARGLRQRGAAVHVVSDAVCSRSKSNFRVGLDQMSAMGAILSSMETAVFDLLGRAGGDDFKALSAMLR
jgi:nicotinamidase-related amidase